MYQMNHRVVANGTPLDARFDNIALMARRAGYQPALFGYTDQAVDPRVANGPDDPRLTTFEGILLGFEMMLDLRLDQVPWLVWLDELGYDTAGGTSGCWRPRASAQPSTAWPASSPTTPSTGSNARTRRGSPTSATGARTRHAAAGHWSRAYSPDEVSCRSLSTCATRCTRPR